MLAFWVNGIRFSITPPQERLQHLYASQQALQAKLVTEQEHL